MFCAFVCKQEKSSWDGAFMLEGAVPGHVQESAGVQGLNLAVFELPSTDREAIGTFLGFPSKILSFRVPIAKRSVLF